MLSQPFPRNGVGLGYRQTRKRFLQPASEFGQGEPVALESAEVRNLLRTFSLQIEQQAGRFHLCPHPIGGIVQVILVSQNNQVVQLLVQRFVFQSSLPMIRAHLSVATFFPPLVASASHRALCSRKLTTSSL